MRGEAPLSRIISPIFRDELHDANRHADYHNLYFTGPSTHPGTGVPTALVSGRLAARRILDDLGVGLS